MSHDRPWEDVDSSGIEFGEVMKLPMVDMGSPWDGIYGTITPLHLSIGGDKDLSQRTRDIVVDDPVWQKMLFMRWRRLKWKWVDFCWEVPGEKLV